MVYMHIVRNTRDKQIFAVLQRITHPSRRNKPQSTGALAALTVGVGLEHESVVPLEKIFPCRSRQLVKTVAVSPVSKQT